MQTITASKTQLRTPMVVAKSGAPGGGRRPATRAALRVTRLPHPRPLHPSSSAPCAPAGRHQHHLLRCRAAPGEGDGGGGGPGGNGGGGGGRSPDNFDGSGDKSNADLRELLVWGAAFLVALPAAWFAFLTRGGAEGEAQKGGAAPADKRPAAAAAATGVANKCVVDGWSSARDRCFCVPFIRVQEAVSKAFLTCQS